MIKSMTGFSTRSRENREAAITLTLKAVNHRYLDLQLRVPTALAGYEAALRRALQQRLTRGRVELTIGLESREQAEFEIEVNQSFVQSLATALQEARAVGLIGGELSAGDLLRHPQALTIRERTGGPGEAADRAAFELTLSTLEEALNELDAMRAEEGAHLRADLDARLQIIGELIERAGRAALAGRGVVEQRLRDRLQELQTGADVDPSILAAEIVRVAARSDITEELVRFRAHVLHWRALAEGPEPCGRRLDFLVQEMNREVNTIGAKADGIEIPELIVTAKAELEKIREQIQNVE